MNMYNAIWLGSVDIVIFDQVEAQALLNCLLHSDKQGLWLNNIQIEMPAYKSTYEQ